MIDLFESIIYKMFKLGDNEQYFSVLNPLTQFNENSFKEPEIIKTINSAFLIKLCGKKHDYFEKADSFLKRVKDFPEFENIVKFYDNGIALIHDEIKSNCESDSEFFQSLKALSEWLGKKENIHNRSDVNEKVWSVFFPEGVGIQANRDESIEKLRAKRVINITDLNKNSIKNPIQQILFTANALLTLPSESEEIEKLPLSETVRKKLFNIVEEEQQFWYDHPVQIGVESDKNEVLYGLRGLDSAVEFERTNGGVSDDLKLTCILSVSVTHDGLHEIAKKYIEEEIRAAGGLKNLEIYIFTESDTNEIIKNILMPACEYFLNQKDTENLLNVFGVDGEYGRHFSFLKALASFWALLIQPEIKATFKIDLDQVFPQQELLDQTGLSAFEHFKTPLWGALGIDANGDLVELGMIAGALVNENDIHKSIFTPDVICPDREPSNDENIFFSALPQALSTESEMMTRYNKNNLDGASMCIQRIHVTGGTTGVLVTSLNKYRPFTPSFIGRAEDQAFILSVLNRQERKLAYVHQDGLIMRHDKESFARKAIESAYIGKLIGDYIRVLYFSAYGKALTDDLKKLKDKIDPFTGCFVSKIPITVVFLRFALKAISLFDSKTENQGLDFIKIGSHRISKALKYTEGKECDLKKQYMKERRGWDMFYDIISGFENSINAGDDFTLELKKKVNSIIENCKVCS